MCARRVLSHGIQLYVRSARPQTASVFDKSTITKRGIAFRNFASGPGFHRLLSRSLAASHLSATLAQGWYTRTNSSVQVLCSARVAIAHACPHAMSNCNDHAIIPIASLARCTPPLMPHQKVRLTGCGAAVYSHARRIHDRCARHFDCLRYGSRLVCKSFLCYLAHVYHQQHACQSGWCLFMCIYLSLIQASPFDTHCLAQKLRDAASLGSASTLGQTAVSSVRSASHLATALWRPAERQIFRTMAVSAVVREKFLAIKARLWSTFTSTRHVLTHSFESRDREAANIHAASSASATYIIRQVPPRNHSSHASHQHPTVHTAVHFDARSLPSQSTRTHKCPLSFSLVRCER